MARQKKQAVQLNLDGTPDNGKVFTKDGRYFMTVDEFIISVYHSPGKFVLPITAKPIVTINGLYYPHYVQIPDGRIVFSESDLKAVLELISYL